VGTGYYSLRDIYQFFYTIGSTNLRGNADTPTEDDVQPGRTKAALLKILRLTQETYSAVAETCSSRHVSSPTQRTHVESGKSFLTTSFGSLNSTFALSSTLVWSTVQLYQGNTCF